MGLLALFPSSDLRGPRNIREELHREQTEAPRQRAGKEPTSQACVGVRSGGASGTAAQLMHTVFRGSSGSADVRIGVRHTS